MFIVFFWGAWWKKLVILGRHVGEVETRDMNGQVYPWAIHLTKMSQRRKPFRPVGIICTIQVRNHHKRFCTVWTLAAIVSSLKWWHSPIIHNFNYNSALLHKLGWVSHISRRQMPSQYLATLHIWYDNMTISQPTKKAQGESENELQNFSPHYELINTSALYTLNISSKWKHVTYQCFSSSPKFSPTLMSTIGYEDQHTFRSLAELKTHLFWILAKALAKDGKATILYDFSGISPSKPRVKMKKMIIQKSLTFAGELNDDILSRLFDQLLDQGQSEGTRLRSMNASSYWNFRKHAFGSIPPACEGPTNDCHFPS